MSHRDVLAIVIKFVLAKRSRLTVFCKAASLVVVVKI